MRRVSSCILLFGAVLLFLADIACAGSAWGAGYVMGVPVYNDSYRDYWQIGHGLSLEYSRALSRRIALSLQSYHLHFNLDNEALVKTFEPSLKGVGNLRFDRGARKTFALQTNFRWSFTPAVKTADFYFTLGGGYCYLHRRSVNGVFYRETGGVSGDSDLIEYSEQLKPRQYVHVWGVNGGFGLAFQTGESTWLYVESKMHGVFSGAGGNQAVTGVVEIALNKDSGRTLFLSNTVGLRREF